MALNNPFQFIRHFKPDAIVSINKIVFEWSHIVINNNTDSRADTIIVHLNLYARSFSIWDSFFKSHEFKIEVLARADENFSYKRIFWGHLDDMEEDPETGDLIVSGRDFSAVMMDTKTTLKFVELTSSEIAKTIAHSHKLKSVVTDTKIPVGTFYQNQIVQLNTTTHEWDLLTFLASLDGFDLYVKDDTLYYVSKDRRSRPYYEIRWIEPALRKESKSLFSNIITMQFFRTFTLAKDIKVKVKSYSIADNKVHTATSSKSRSVGTRAGSTQEYSVLGPNMTQEEAQQLAQNTALNISRHELKFAAELLADNILEKDDIIEVKGKSSVFDTKYYIDSLERTLIAGNDGGYWFKVMAKNHPTANVYTTL